MPELGLDRRAERFADERIVRDKAAVRVHLTARGQSDHVALFIAADEEDGIVRLSQVHAKIITARGN